MILCDSTDEEQTEDTTVTALHTAVEWHIQQQAFIVPDHGHLVLKGIDSGDQTAYGVLHLPQPLDLRLIGFVIGLHNQNFQNLT